MARNRGGRSIAGTVFLWFVAVLMIIGAAVGIKWVKNTEFNFNGTSNAETSTSIVPVSIPSDEDVSSIEDSSSESISSEVIIEPNPIDELPEVESRGKFITYGEENIAPLIQTAYRSSATYALLTLLDNNNESTNFSFNSLKMTKVPDSTELRIQFGFPSTLNETHYDQFGLGGAYSSYLIGEYKMLNDEGLYINFNDDLLTINEGYKAYFYFIYRNNENLEWQNVKATAEQLFIEADNLYYQFGLVFNVNSKSTRAWISEFKLGGLNMTEEVESHDPIIEFAVSSEEVEQEVEETPETPIKEPFGVTRFNALGPTNKKTLTVTIEPANAPIGTITWLSDKSQIVVTAIGDGRQAEVYATTFLAKSDYATITVTESLSGLSATGKVYAWEQPAVVNSSVEPYYEAISIIDGGVTVARKQLPTSGITFATVDALYKTQYQLVTLRIAYKGSFAPIIRYKGLHQGGNPQMVSASAGGQPTVPGANYTFADYSIYIFEGDPSYGNQPIEYKVYIPKVSEISAWNNETLLYNIPIRTVQ